MALRDTQHVHRVYETGGAKTRKKGAGSWRNAKAEVESETSPTGTFQSQPRLSLPTGAFERGSGCQDHGQSALYRLPCA